MAAKVLLVGGDPVYILNLKDQVAFTIFEVIVNRALEYRQTYAKNLATDIANKVSKSLAGKN